MCIINSFIYLFIRRMVFFLATLVTAAVFITDRMDGVWERTLVAGQQSYTFIHTAHTDLFNHHESHYNYVEFIHQSTHIYTQSLMIFALL